MVLSRGMAQGSGRRGACARKEPTLGLDPGIEGPDKVFSPDGDHEGLE